MTKWAKSDDLGKYGIVLIAETKKIPLGDTNDDYQIYNIPLQLLKYNRTNGRIFMETNKLQEDGDVDLAALEQDNVEQFNDEIEKLIWESDVEKNTDTLGDIYKYTQLESGVVLDDGTVIDGNRRFTCLRKLSKNYPLDERFKYFRAAIIFREGSEITPKDIKKYELKAQFGRDEKANYRPINFAMSIYKSVKEDGFEIQEIADDVHQKPGDITKIINTCELIEEMLDYINQKGQLYVAEELNLYWPLEPLASYLNGAAGSKLTPIEKEKRKHLFFDYVLSIDTPLPTQEFRDNLIKKIFTDESLWQELSSDYEQHSAPSVNRELLSNKDAPSDFVSRVKTFRSSQAADDIKKSYKHAVDKKNMEKQANAPIDLCNDLLERIKQINVEPFVDAPSATADNILRRVDGLLIELTDRANEIRDKIAAKNK